MPFTLELGQKAPAFHLPATDNKTYSLADFAANPILVICFTCNHCPYVIGNESREKAFVEKFQSRGVAYAAINSNDVNAYANDDFPHMVQRAKTLGFTGPTCTMNRRRLQSLWAIKTPRSFSYFDQQARVLRHMSAAWTIRRAMPRWQRRTNLPMPSMIFLRVARWHCRRPPPSAARSSGAARRSILFRWRRVIWGKFYKGNDVIFLLHAPTNPNGRRFH